MRIITLALLMFYAALSLAEVSDSGGNSDPGFFGSWFGSTEEVEEVNVTIDENEFTNNDFESEIKEYRELDERTQEVERKLSELLVNVDENNKSIINLINDLNKQINVLSHKSENGDKDLIELRQSLSQTVLQNKSDLKVEVENVRKSVEEEIKRVNAQHDELNMKINSVKQEFNDGNKITLLKAQKIEDLIGVRKEETAENFNDIKQVISENTLYWIVSVLFVSVLMAIVFVYLNKRIFNQKANLNNDLLSMKAKIDEESIKLDNKLIEVIDTQLKADNNKSTEEADHSLALKVADEIIRIQKNTSLMDEKTKGLKQLSASVQRIQDNFLSNGYEIVPMLGLQYNEGMKVSVNFVPDEDLEEGQQVITKIIKPQVNFQGVMIQSAQLEVSQGE